jgi:uncharacterized phage-associated protein
MHPWYNVRKVAQVVAFFASKEGGTINVLKLAKLLYLSDRQNMKEYDFPITYDDFVSMPNGPVNSITLDYINGTRYHGIMQWQEFIDGRTNYDISATRVFEERELNELSRADLGTLNAIWQKFGHMNKYQLVEWTHRNCGEWRDPDGSSEPIEYVRVFEGLNKENAEELAHDIETEKALSTAFAVE